MPRIDETAYRQLKAVPTERELRELYTPTLDERYLAKQHTTGKPALVAFLVLLKTFRHLGYPVALSSVPMPIVSHIAKQMECPVTGQDLISYDLSGTRRRHVQVIRSHLQIVAEGSAMRQAMEQAMREACESKDDVIDLINIAIEQLIRQRFELPAFSTLERTAKRIRAEVTSALHARITTALTPAEQEAIDRLFLVDPETGESTWQALKVDPQNPTLSHFETLMARASWLLSLPISTEALADVPDVKIQRFATEAPSLDANRMKDLQVRKRATLALSLLRVQRAQILDDVAEMFCKRLLKIQHQGQEAFDLAKIAANARVTRLIETLRDVTRAYEKEGTMTERMEAIDAVYGGTSEQVLTDCEAQLALLANTSLPFLRTFVSRHRASLFRFLSTVTLRSPHQNKALEEAIQFLQANEHRSGKYLRTARIEPHKGSPPQIIPLVDLSWMSETWRRIVTGKAGRKIIPERVDRQHSGLKQLEKLLALKLTDTHILDLMADVQHWLNWCGCFGPLSGFETKLEDATLRQMLTVFAYGSHMGPAQMARSFAAIHARHIAWIHHEHMSEEKLDQAITRVVNGYHRFDLPRRCWGTGKRASADGTKWEVYTHNLLAEYHIRYGGYGGIGYYHVSDTYIALFSHFIPCGVHEAVYILDGLLNNDSDIKPVEVTGDTQAQNAVVFGLAHLLGIRLMPRIRNWKDLTLYRPTPQSRYEHINALFSGDIDWDLIERHVPDLLRIVLSIKNGTITASTILANLVIFANVALLTDVLNELASEGHRIDPEAVAALSPYMTQHLVRFGLYHMDQARRPKPLTYQVTFEPEKVQEEENEAAEVA